MFIVTLHTDTGKTDIKVFSSLGEAEDFCQQFVHAGNTVIVDIFEIHSDSRVEKAGHVVNKFGFFTTYYQRIKR